MHSNSEVRFDSLGVYKIPCIKGFILYTGSQNDTSVDCQCAYDIYKSKLEI